MNIFQEFPIFSKLDPVIYGPVESAIKSEHVERELNGMSVQQVTTSLIFNKDQCRRQYQQARKLDRIIKGFKSSAPFLNFLSLPNTHFHGKAK